MFTITDTMIRNATNNHLTYQKGLTYYYNRRVHNYVFDEQGLVVEASVWGSNDYDVEVAFYESGEIESAYCTCPAFYKYDGICKHVIATLMKTQEEMRKNQLKKVHAQRATNSIFQFFEDFKEEGFKKEVQLEVTYELERSYPYSDAPLSSISLRMGEERLYVVRNLKKFFEVLDDTGIVEFGKNFTFESQYHEFKEIDQQIMELLRELYELEKITEQLSYRNGTESVFAGKKTYIPSTVVKRLVPLLKNKSFTANIFGKEYSNVSVLTEDIPMVFTLTEDNKDLLLQWEQEDFPIPLTKGGEYFFFQGNIYEVSKKQRQYFLPFYEAFSKNANQLRFKNRDKDRFVSEVLPLTKNIGKVHIDPKVEERFYQVELQTEIYLDKQDEGISAQVQFIYGEEKIEPFSNKGTSFQNKILIRDVEKERRVLNLLEQAEFKVGKDKVYMEEEDHIFDFMYQILPRLQEEATVFYSDAFKNMQIKDTRSLSGGIRLSEETDMLEFSFDLGDLDREELKDVFASLREKKKYYRLKNGAFLPLDSSELTQLGELVQFLDLKDKDLMSEMIQLPKYRALYIDQQIREGNMKQIERNLPFKQLVQNIMEPGDMDFSPPAELQPILRDYQRLGFKWLSTLGTYGLGGILADDMGLGKTLQTIAFILSGQEESKKPSLVIAPTSLVYNWQDEVIKFAPHMKVLVISGNKEVRAEAMEEIQEADIVVTSYALIRRDIEDYEKYSFRYCFLDEAQHIKNPNSMNAKSVKQIKAQGYFALTGTPIENSLTELWSIFDFIMPGYLLSHSKFVNKYEKPIIKDKDQNTLKELTKQIRPFILRRMKKDVLKELPPKIESKMTAELTDEQKKVYLAYLQDIKGELSKELAANGYEKSQMQIIAALTRLRQICCHPGLFLEDYKGKSGKLELLQEILEDAIGSGHRILLFSQFTSMLGLIKEMLHKEKISYFYLDGSTKVEDRRDMVKAFNEGEKEMFLISLKAGGTGLNLTGADMVIHYDPWWNPAVEEQATDRAYRIGQKNVVQVMKLIAQGTIEEKIYELQQRKKAMIESVIQPGETMLSKMNEEEIRALFEL